MKARIDDLLESEVDHEGRITALENRPEWGVVGLVHSLIFRPGPAPLFRHSHRARHGPGSPLFLAPASRTFLLWGSSPPQSYTNNPLTAAMRGSKENAL